MGSRYDNRTLIRIICIIMWCLSNINKLGLRIKCWTFNIYYVRYITQSKLILYIILIVIIRKVEKEEMWSNVNNFHLTIDETRSQIDKPSTTNNTNANVAR